MFATTLRGPSLTALAADSTRLGHYFSELPNTVPPSQHSADVLHIFDIDSENVCHLEGGQCQ